MLSTEEIKVFSINVKTFFRSSFIIYLTIINILSNINIIVKEVEHESVNINLAYISWAINIKLSIHGHVVFLSLFSFSLV